MPLPPLPPPLLQPLRRNPQPPWGKIIQHNHIRARLNRLIRLLLGPALYLDFDRKPADGVSRLDGVGDRSRAPDMVVFEHDHGGEIVSMGVDAAD